MSGDSNAECDGDNEYHDDERDSGFGVVCKICVHKYLFNLILLVVWE